MGALPAEIERRVDEEVARRGLVLVDLVRRGQSNTSVIEVVVDAVDRQVTLEELTELSRWTSALLDEAEAAIPGRYRLEVSTPGLSRPLEHPWQFRKNTGRLCTLTIESDGGTLDTRLFRIIEVGDGDLLVEPIGNARRARAAGEPTRISFDRIRKAVIEPEV